MLDKAFNFIVHIKLYQIFMFMRFLINENAFENLVMDYINANYNLKELHWTNPYDYDYAGNEYEDSDRVYFYLGDYEGEDDTYFVLRWYDKGYYEKEIDDEVNYYHEILLKNVEGAPILAMPEEDYDNFTSLFGNKWLNIFKKWFTENFGLEVNSIVRDIYT